MLIPILYNYKKSTLFTFNLIIITRVKMLKHVSAENATVGNYFLVV